MSKHGNYGWAKLTEDAVRAIRSVPEYHGVNTHLAKHYCVSVATIYGVRHGYTWKHVSQKAARALEI